MSTLQKSVKVRVAKKNHNFVFWEEIFFIVHFSFLPSLKSLSNFLRTVSCAGVLSANLTYITTPNQIDDHDHVLHQQNLSFIILRGSKVPLERKKQKDTGISLLLCNVVWTFTVFSLLDVRLHFPFYRLCFTYTTSRQTLRSLHPFFQFSCSSSCRFHLSLWKLPQVVTLSFLLNL